MNASIITVRVDAETKKEAEALFAELGLPMSTAINIFLKQAVREGKIPFEIAKVTKSPLAGPGRKIKSLRK